MFIKIGDEIINTDNVIRIQGDESGVTIEFNVIESDGENSEPYNLCYIRTDDDYPQALAAYDWFCKAAIRFDDPATEPAPASAATGERYQAIALDSESQDYTLYAVVDTEIGDKVTEPTRLRAFAEVTANAMNLAAKLPLPATSTPQADSNSGATGEQLTSTALQAYIMEYFANCDPHHYAGKRTAQMVYEALLEMVDDYEIVFGNVLVALNNLALAGKLEIIVPNSSLTWYRATPQPDSSTPSADSDSGCGKTPEYYLDKDGDYFRLYKTSQVAPVADFSYGEKAVAELTTRLLNAETSSLRNQLAAATSELESMKARVAESDKLLVECGQSISKLTAENNRLADAILKAKDAAEDPLNSPSTRIQRVYEILDVFED